MHRRVSCAYFQSRQSPRAPRLLSQSEQSNFALLQDSVRVLVDHSARQGPERQAQSDYFDMALEKLWDFVHDGDDENRWKRALICGIIKSDEGIATNVHQLQEVMGKPKSFINGRLRTRYHSEKFDHVCAALLAFMPEFVRNNPNEYRHWSFRYFALPGRRRQVRPEREASKLEFPVLVEGDHRETHVPAASIQAQAMPFPCRRWRELLGGYDDD
jgi:hypothetical protein